MSKQCAYGCDAKVLHPHPEWRDDPDMEVCGDCLISALEERVDDAMQALDDARLDLYEAIERKKKGA